MKHDWQAKMQCTQCLGVQTSENAGDDRCSGMVVTSRYGDGVISEAGDAYERVSGVVRRPDGAIAKESLVHGAYYYGRCRNASIARWDAAKQVFYYWRQKFMDTFTEDIQCREDDLHMDVFDPFVRLEDSIALKTIPLSEHQND